MVQLRRIPLATMSPAPTPSLVWRWRLGLRMNVFIHSSEATSTDLEMKNECNERKEVFLFVF